MARRAKKTPAVPVRGGWVLPHGMGALGSASTQPGTLPTPAAPDATTATVHTAVSSVAAGSHETHAQSAQSDQPPVSNKAVAEVVGELPANEPQLQPRRQSKRKGATQANDVTEDSISEPPPKRLQVLRRSTRSTRSKYSTSLKESESDGGLSLTAATTKNTSQAIHVEIRVEVRQETSEHIRQELHEEIQGEVHTKVADRDGVQGDNIQYEGIIQATSTAGDITQAPSARSKRASRKAKNKADGDYLDEPPKKPKRVPRKTKDNPYGLTPGTTPFPDWQAPSADQCEEVYRILADMHDDVQPQAPEVIPAPSMEVTGCGEVPYVLEALVRTLLSGAVTFAGAAKMLQGIIRKFGVLGDGPAKGSIDWNKIRLSSMEDVVEAIREGGLAKNKAKSIKGILDMVHQENIGRREAYLAERQTGVLADVYGAAEKTESQKDLEILKTEQNILSLDHMRGLSADEAMRQFTKFPGVGVKTAACVILFCLQRPCFAVDTHVHKFSRWLGWAPEKADENDVFSHLEIRCPDHLKYGLHQLFIRHGQTCGRCKKSTAEGTKEWDAIVCPLEHLLVRLGKRQAKPKPAPKRGKGAKKEDEDEDEKEDLKGDNVAAETEQLIEAKGNEGTSEDTDSELSEIDDMNDGDYQE
ncbi:DNA glycosylase [Xylariaceae sp. FL0255]|nr:DNA glycosylase [Xylariaceae sp. FL0255]